MHHEKLEEALPGMNVGFNVKQFSVKELKRGFVMSYNDSNKASKISKFEANVIITGKCGKGAFKINAG
jgi:elongation factor 1-alpha